MDAVRRGRWKRPQGEAHPYAILTLVQVQEIKKFLGTISCRQLGEMYGVSKSAIAAISRGRSWAQV